MKRVAILLSSEPKSGGEHQYLMLVTDALVRCNNIYFNVVAICTNRFWVKWCREHKIEYISKEVKYYTNRQMVQDSYFSLFKKVYNRYFCELGSYLYKNKISVLICGQQSIYTPPLLCRVIRPAHDLMHRYLPEFEEISSTYNERESLFSSTARFSDVILVDSQVGKRQYEECFFHKFRHNPRIEVLPFAIPKHINNGVEECIEVPAKYLFYPAQFWEHKNHKNLLLAIELLKDKIPDIHLVLVGSERNSLSKIRTLIREKSLDSHISILGFVKDEQITYLYKHAVAMVMPSFAGPTNIPPLEAMALGCPVIVANNYAMGEQVGEAGLLCDPYSPADIADCIDKVWNDSNLRAKLEVAGLKKSKEWTAADFKKKFIKTVLRELKQ